jgi:hypothetical protein
LRVAEGDVAIQNEARSTTAALDCHGALRLAMTRWGKFTHAPDATRLYGAQDVPAPTLFHLRHGLELVDVLRGFGLGQALHEARLEFFAFGGRQRAQFFALKDVPGVAPIWSGMWVCSPFLSARTRSATLGGKPAGSFPPKSPPLSRMRGVSWAGVSLWRELGTG